MLPIWSVRLMIYKEGELFDRQDFKDTSFLLTSGLPPVEQFDACVEYVAIRGQTLSTCDIEMVSFTSAPLGKILLRRF